MEFKKIPRKEGIFGKNPLAGTKRNIICYKRREYIKAYDTKRGGILIDIL